MNNWAGSVLLLGCGLDNQQISVKFLARAEDCFSRLDTGHIQPPIHEYWGLLLGSKEAEE